MSLARVRSGHDPNLEQPLAQLVPLTAPEAVYWFFDGSHRGREAILPAISETFATIRDEIYQISDVEWIAQSDDHAAGRPDPSSVQTRHLHGTAA